MSQDFYQILGVGKTARPDEIKKAYLQMAKEAHPDRFTDPEERAAADERFQLITQAYNQLRDEKLRYEYDKSLERKSRTPEEEAQLYYKNGQMREDLKDYENALKLYYEAMRIKPDNLDYAMSAGRILAMDKTKQRQAADLFARVIEQHPEAPEPHLELGAVYSRTGMLSRAKRVYENAMKQFPTHPEIRRRLADVNAGMTKK